MLLRVCAGVYNIPCLCVVSCNILGLLTMVILRTWSLVSWEEDGKWAKRLKRTFSHQRHCYAPVCRADSRGWGTYSIHPVSWKIHFSILFSNPHICVNTYIYTILKRCKQRELQRVGQRYGSVRGAVPEHGLWRNMGSKCWSASYSVSVFLLPIWNRKLLPWVWRNLLAKFIHVHKAIQILLWYSAVTIIILMF